MMDGLGFPKCSDVPDAVGKRAELLGQTDHDVPDSSRATKPVADRMQPEWGNRPRAHQHDDPIGEPSSAAKRLPFVRPLPGFEPKTLGPMDQPHRLLHLR